MQSIPFWCKIGQYYLEIARRGTERSLQQMDDKVKDLLDRIRGTASVAADAAADTARVAGRKAGQMVDVAKLNVQLFDLTGDLNDILRQLGQVMYDTHLGRAPQEDSVGELLARADGLSEKIAEVKGRIADLRQTKACPACGAPCGKEDKFCRRCGAGLE